MKLIITKKVLSLALVLGVVLFSFSARAAIGEEKLKIEVQANYIKMGENVSRAPIARVLIRSTDLRELIKTLGATHIEKIYESVELPDGTIEEQEVPGIYVLIFPKDTNIVAEIASFTAIDVVQSAILE